MYRGVTSDVLFSIIYPRKSYLGNMRNPWRRHIHAQQAQVFAVDLFFIVYVSVTFGICLTAQLLACHRQILSLCLSVTWWLHCAFPCHPALGVHSHTAHNYLHNLLNCCGKLAGYAMAVAQHFRDLQKVCVA